jgi:hypothetical protein
VARSCASSGSGGWHRAADDRSDLQQRLGPSAEAVDALGDHALDRRRHAQPVERVEQFDVARLAFQQAFAGDVAHHLLDEQRHAAGVAQDA